MTDGGAYAQPTPREFYIHDDLTDEVAAEAGPDSPAARLARELIARVAADRVRVRVLTLAEQVERVAAQGPHAPFALAVGVGRAGERVAQALHARTGWFPNVRRVGVTREEDGAGGYRLVSTEPGGLAARLGGRHASLAIVDDTVFSGLTIRFRRGEAIWTESSYKFTRPGVESLLDAVGLRLHRWHVDPANYFALALIRPA